MLVGIKKAWSANRALQFPNNYPLLSHVAVRERCILLLINKELISGRLPLTVLQRLQEEAAITGLGGTHGSSLHPGNVELCSERNKPGLSPKQDSVSDIFMILILVPEKKKNPFESNLIDSDCVRTVTYLSGFASLLRFSAEVWTLIFVCLLFNFCYFH